MNIADRNAELDKARALKVTIEQAEARLDVVDDEEGTLKNSLQEAPSGVSSPDQGGHAYTARDGTQRPDQRASGNAQHHRT